jgi:Leucine-rich repeat (LRR) protein
MEVTSMSNMPLRIVKLIRQNQQQSDPILDLSDEYLSEVPIEILELTHLEKLLLSGNHI